MATGTTARWYQSGSAIDATSTGTHNVDTTVTEPEYTRDFYLEGANVILVSLSNVLVSAVINIGTNSPDYNNIVSNQAIAGVSGQVLPINLMSAIGVITEGTEIKCKVATPASALIGGPVCTFIPVVFGHDTIY